jgi:hypothetical protein
MCFSPDLVRELNQDEVARLVAVLIIDLDDRDTADDQLGGEQPAIWAAPVDRRLIRKRFASLPEVFALAIERQIWVPSG